MAIGWRVSVVGIQNVASWNDGYFIMITHLKMLLKHIGFYGLVLAIALMVIGGTFNLYAVGREPLYSVATFSKQHFETPALKIIGCGVGLILLLQFIRVFLVSAIFIAKKDYIMGGLSGFIFLVLTYSFVYDYF